jgi:hypothetical protein
VDADERDTQVLGRAADGERRRSYGSPPIGLVLVLVFAGAPIGAHETAAELQGVAAERQRVLLAARARIERQRPSAAGFVESDGRRRE